MGRGKQQNMHVNFIEHSNIDAVTVLYSLYSPHG